MKNIKIIILFIAVFCLVSCKSYLDIKPYGKTIPKTPEEFAALINNRLNDIDFGEEYVVGDIVTVATYACYCDNLERNLAPYPDSRLVPLYIGERLSNQQLFYSRLYEVIRDCNIIIGNMKDDKSELASNVLGTSYALRGVCYYRLLRNFCDNCYKNENGLGVPLVTEFNMEAKPIRSTIKQTVDLCVSDMKKAISYNINKPIFRFNNDVMYGYLARTYFWAGQYDKAIEYSKKVLKSHPLISGEEYKNMIESTLAPKGNILLKSCILVTNNNLAYNGMVEYARKCPISSRFLELFPEKEKDIRYDLYVGERRVFKKYPLPCLRSAEMQLILAESLYHIGDEGGALAALNELRRNRISDYKPYTMATLPPVNQDDFIKVDCTGKPLTPLLYAILAERRKELFMEGDRWYELKRNGKPEFWVARQGRKYTTLKYMYTFPLPVDDLLLVKGLKQNPGYDKVQ